MGTLIHFQAMNQHCPRCQSPQPHRVLGWWCPHPQAKNILQCMTCFHRWVHMFTVDPASAPNPGPQPEEAPA